MQRFVIYLGESIDTDDADRLCNILEDALGDHGVMVDSVQFEEHGYTRIGADDN